MSGSNEKSPLLLHHQLLEQVGGHQNHNNKDEEDRTSNEEGEKQLSTHSWWKSYNYHLDRNPILVKCITAFFILGLGDLAGQGVEHCRGTNTLEGMDWMRTLRFALIGLFGASWSHVYFYYLDLYLPPTESPWTLTTVVKLVIDQALQAPILLALIIAALAILKGTGIEGVKEDLLVNFWDALVANCTYFWWIAPLVSRNHT